MTGLRVQGSGFGVQGPGGIGPSRWQGRAGAIASLLVLSGLLGAVMLAVPPPPASGDDEVGEEGRFIDPLGPNAACYVCHLTFVHEELSVVHKAEKVTCIECHGLSAGHANDEDIGATPPDVVYKRERIDAACRECHEGHDVSAAAVLARFFERKLKPEPAAVCTDCHGQHRIAEAASATPGADVIGGG